MMQFTQQSKPSKKKRTKRRKIDRQEISPEFEEGESQAQEVKTKTKTNLDDGAMITTKVHFTARNPPWSYLTLELISYPDSTSPQPPQLELDVITAQTYLTSALSQFLGLTGSAIPIDILKLDGHSATSPSTISGGVTRKCGNVVFIRVPRDDAAAVVAAVSSWIGGGSATTGHAVGINTGGVAWRVCAKGNFLAAVVAGSGKDLFLT